ncbi:acyl-CoA synthetase [Amphritea sp. 2_MG-2023]|uniref:acyl-CoA synthetase n=1 Tax=Amphritea sp. 2_MG-2023 TaxID=3062682 RepID=UPI001C065855|nr:MULTISPECIES: acyl-CoA synthetase [Amphritea]MBU2964072.1 acyl-CoA synthetase [Amphritea atlantica]MDO6418470.1 acyl-CoA synthetase [Amphritea sp. 2_MG-2023]
MQKQTTTINEPFTPSFPIKCLADIEQLEQTPLEQALPVRSTYEIMRNSAHAFGERNALTFLRTTNLSEEPIRWTYNELLAGINQTANLLHELGVKPDDAVAVMLPGCLEYHLALWGGEAAGIVQPLNPLLNDEKLISLMNAGRAKVLIAYGNDDDSGIWSKAMRICNQVPTLTHVLRVAPHDEAALPSDLPNNVIDFSTARAGQPTDHLVSGRLIEADDIAAYFHTGGTTGAPKLARHSHGAQVFTAWASVKFQGSTSQDIVINGFPLFHVAGVLPGALTALACGMETIIPTTALYRNRDVITDFWRLVEAHRVTVLSAVPTVLAALANVPLDGADISSLKYCRTGAAPLSPELTERFERLFGLHAHESLGMTEMAGISAITPPGVVAPTGCVGFRLPYAQLRIVALDSEGGASDNDMPLGEQGMVLFKSPNLFSGFLDTQSTSHAFTDDGWLATGDLGWLDDQGRLHLSGRSKDLIIRSGHNIDPKEIEDAVSAHPAVQFAAAVGAPDAYAGELPVVFVTLIDGASATEEELLAFTAAGVDEPPARPKKLLVIDAMPMTNVGKIYKPRLRALAAEAVVRDMVEVMCLEHGLTMRPKIEIEQDQRVLVLLHHVDLEGIRQRLQEVLAPLPFITQLVSH